MYIDTFSFMNQMIRAYINNHLRILSLMADNRQMVA